MNLYITIPALIFNTICNYFSLKSIPQYYQSSDYPHRLIMIAILISSSYLTSFVAIFPTLLNFGILDNPIVCYFYAALNYISYSVTPLSLLFLAVYVVIILFTKLKKKTLNNLGRAMVFFIFVTFAILEFVLMPTFNATPIRPHEVRGITHKRLCVAGNKGFRDFLNIFGFVSSAIILTFSILLMIYNFFKSSTNFRYTQKKISLSFFLFSLIKVVDPLRYILENVWKIKINTELNYIISDLTKFQSGLYSLVYYFIEVYDKKDLATASVDNILFISKWRNLYKDFLVEAGDRKLYDLVCKWESINEKTDRRYEILDQDNLRGREAKKLIEKIVADKIDQFIMTETFMDSFRQFENLGEIDLGLMENQND